MYDPKDDIGAMVNALRQPAQGVQLAGDVIPLPIIPTPNAGNTNLSAPYAVGKEQAPGIAPIPLDMLRAWMERTASRPR
jgi:hypothetical protein